MPASSALETSYSNADVLAKTSAFPPSFVVGAVISNLPMSISRPKSIVIQGLLDGSLPQSSVDVAFNMF